MTKETKQYGYIETDPKMPLCGEYCSISYSMFTEFGDTLVDGIVNVAKQNGKITRDRYGRRETTIWPWVYEKLEMLGKTKGFEEATDTMVREAVYDALVQADIIEDDEPFYI